MWCIRLAIVVAILQWSSLPLLTSSYNNRKGFSFKVCLGFYVFSVLGVALWLVWLPLCVLHWFEMSHVPIALAFTLQVASRGMSIVLTFMLALSPRLAKLLCLYKSLPFLCYTLVLSPLLLGVSFRLILVSFSGCLKFISHALNCFHRISRTI